MPSSALTPTELSTLSLHDALPISFASQNPEPKPRISPPIVITVPSAITPVNSCRGAEPTASRIPNSLVRTLTENASTPATPTTAMRSEEHTSELQSQFHLVCRLLLSHPPSSPLFPYTTLFRSLSPARTRSPSRESAPRS